MSAVSKHSEAPIDDRRYQPAPIPVPPLFSLPIRPRAILRWLVIDLFVPWGLLWVGLAFLCWQFFTPQLTTMADLKLSWITAVWLRNAILLGVVAGGLHWWFYIKRAQSKQTKFTDKWLARNDSRFLFKDQVKDNMFWGIVSGVTVWTAYECLTYWWYANNYVQWQAASDSIAYLILMFWGVVFWSTLHFYVVHRALHWQPFYERAHKLHHLNSNTGPWSGISMHPVEHVLYFSLFLLWWIVPVHPIIIIMTGLFQGVGPAVSHSGFDYLKMGESIKIPTGDNFHNLHHRHFKINYGNSATPLDWLFGSWHDGAEHGKEVLRSRLRSR